MLVGTVFICLFGHSLISVKYTQLAITCSKLTIETLEQGVKYAQLTTKIPEPHQWRLGINYLRI